MDCAKIKRDHTCHIDHQGQVATDRHGHAIANSASREHYPDITTTLLDKNNSIDDQNQKYDHQDKHPPTILLVAQQTDEVLGHTRNDTGKNDQGKTLIWNTVFRNQLPQPNTKHCSGNHGN